ncbi:hypothetical protein TNCT_617291 [Trichonephila clavata]|uniref:Uncharacterized protein n=1 Tax=Trichonephila clavata TaxID=2740835 RepID=A0A8X6FDG3_TRICU|nr:hypothetical protein TNCT_617291 [Trichonephila clavata]
MEKMKTIGFTQLKRCLYLACALAIPCKSNRTNQRALLLNRRDLCSERRFDDIDCVHRGCFTYYLPLILQTEDFSRKFIPGTCVMNENCWLELAQIRKRITESALSMVFDCIFKNCC